MDDVDVLAHTKIRDQVREVRKEEVGRTRDVGGFGDVGVHRSTAETAAAIAEAMVRVSRRGLARTSRGLCIYECRGVGEGLGSRRTAEDSVSSTDVEDGQDAVKRTLTSGPHLSVSTSRKRKGEGGSGLLLGCMCGVARLETAQLGCAALFSLFFVHSFLFSVFCFLIISFDLVIQFNSNKFMKSCKVNVYCLKHFCEHFNTFQNLRFSNII